MDASEQEWVAEVLAEWCDEMDLRAGLRIQAVLALADSLPASVESVA